MPCQLCTLLKCCTYAKIMKYVVYFCLEKMLLYCLWIKLIMCYSISTICQNAEYILELYIHIQIQTIQLLIFTEKFLPLPGFEPRTSLVPSRYATNWAILAWNIHYRWRTGLRIYQSENLWNSLRNWFYINS